MAEDEDPVIAPVLAKLAAQDAAAAEDARAALGWIVGDQGLALITQQRIQNFCWYDLPVKWLVDFDEKLRVVAALAQALDLLQLPRYAAICRSGTTREVLNAYETSIAHGKAAFRRAAAASGIMPPDLPDFQRAPVMGMEEASAWSSTAEFLEVAVASGDLVPGRRGRKARQQELVRAHLDVPQAGLLGQTLAQVIPTERTETWINRHRPVHRPGGPASEGHRPANHPVALTIHALPRLRRLRGNALCRNSQAASAETRAHGPATHPDTQAPNCCSASAASRASSTSLAKGAILAAWLTTQHGTGPSTTR